MLVNQPNHKITFLLSYSSLFHLGAWRNSIQLLTKKGYAVNMVQFEDENVKELQSDLEKKYNLIQIPYSIIVKSIMYLLKFSFRSLRKFGLGKLSTVGDGIDYLIKGFYFVLIARLRLRNDTSEIYIGGDPPSLMAAYFLSRKNENKLIFWELELLLEKELPDFGSRLFKRYEKKYSKKAICAVEFGEKRSELLRKENDIPNHIPIISIPNSRIGEPNMARNYYFNDKFNIPRERKIVLFAGSIFNDMKEIDALWESFQNWQDDFVLVVHSHVRPNLAQKFIIPEKLRTMGRIFFDDVPLPYDKINYVYASCDIGLILIRLKGEMNSNLYYSDLSLGKLFHYLYSGVPVISRRLFGYDVLIEKNGVGLCFDTPEEISNLVVKIMDNEIYYKENCIALSKKYAFEKYHSILEKYLEKSEKENIISDYKSHIQ